jgi:CRP-like cAMP-binding protein
MPTTDVSGLAVKNHLLAELPPLTLRHISDRLQLVALRAGDVIYESGEEITHVYFPITAIISLLYIMENGSTAEIGLAGNNGAVGLAIFLGSVTTIGRAVVLNSGDALRVSRRVAEELFETESRFRKLILLYIQSLLVQVSQTAVCNRLHSIEQRLCRWLLMNDDMLESHDLVVTQELLASMLGVRREGVSAAASELQKLNLIRYARGKVTIVDRRGLEREACECYQVVIDEYDRLLGHYIPLNR